VNWEGEVRKSIRRAPAAIRRSFRISNFEFQVRRGFTLLEVALVLALLVVIMGLVWPALEGTFDAQRLKSAADQLRADFTQARVTAMNTGRPQLLSFDAASGRYAVVPVDDGTATDPFSLPVEVAPAGAAPFAGRPLPEGVTFHAIAVLDDVPPPPSASAAVTTHSIYFHPDGTTSSARVTLSGDRAMFIDVRLRGLTGATAVGDVFATEGEL
jgi:prepilin-type N-terminal cleavage/methylation domain-containing protein